MLGTIAREGERSLSHQLQDVRPTLIMDACLLAGKVMLQSGAETHRVEDTMIRIAASCGVKVHSFVMPTGIIVSIDDTEWTQLVRISDRSTDLLKVHQVNQVSRQLSDGTVTIEDAYAQLKMIYEASSNYSTLFRILAAAITSGAFLFMFGGSWRDVIPACVSGAVGLSLVSLVHQWIQLKFFAELAASFAIGLVASLFVMAGLGRSLDIIIIASVMPLVPGILITNAVRDLMSGHLVSGISKGAEASLTAFAIGAGIAVSIQVF